MILKANGAEWGGPEDDWYHVYWWNLLPAEHRFLGYSQTWYDGPYSMFGWWFGNISWRLPWTSHDGTKGWTINAKTQKPPGTS